MFKKLEIEYVEFFDLNYLKNQSLHHFIDLYMCVKINLNKNNNRHLCALEKLFAVWISCKHIYFLQYILPIVYISEV